MKTMKTMKLMIVALIIGMMGVLNAYSSDSDFDKYKTSYEKALERIEQEHVNDVNSIKEKYELHLDKALKIALSKGDIKAYDQLKEQKAEFMEKRELPEKHAGLLEKPAIEKQKAIAKLSEKYKDALTKLKVKVAQSGNIDEARKIDEAIDAVSFVIAENKVEEEVVKKTVADRSKPLVTVRDIKTEDLKNIAPEATIKASGYIKDLNGKSYPPEKIADSDFSDNGSWVLNRFNSAVGDWVSLKWEDKRTISKISIYDRSHLDIWVQEVRIEYSNKEIYLKIKNNGTASDFVFDRPINVDYLKIEVIRSMVETKSRLGLSEVEVFGK